MKYKNFDGTIEKLIRLKLREIEENEQVRVIYAIESGSRAWGFASPDSDYDVRFIYVRSIDDYLALEDTKDFIDWELDETLDINGWDISKVLRHFHKSNATLFEWSNSPIVYKTTEEWQQICKVAKEYFSCKSTMYHYYGTANKNFHEYLRDDMVKYKKYFYVLRPILAYKWIQKYQCPPPVLYSQLVDAVLEEDMKPVMEELLEAKIRMIESEKGPKIQKVNDYIQNNLQEMKKTLNQMEDDRKEGWEALNLQFLKSVRDIL